MIKSFITIALVAIAMVGSCQTYKVGNVLYKADTVVTKTTDTTGYYYCIKDIYYPIYKGAKGGYFIYRTSKEGKMYKQYLKKEEVELLIK